MKTLCADLGGSRVKLAIVEDGRVTASEMFTVGANTAETLVAVAENGRELMSRTGGAFAGLAYGCAMGETDAVIVILGTGVGTSAVSGGRIVRGRHFTHGLLGGHLPINFDGDRRCTCGAMNCLEAYVGSWALKEMAGDPAYDYRRLERDYAAGDEKARRLFGVVSRALGAGTVALVHAFDPEAVIWSGGVSRFAALIDAAQRYVHENAWTPWGKIRFLKAADPEASVTLGLHSLYGGMKD